MKEGSGGEENNRFEKGRKLEKTISGWGHGWRKRKEKKR